MGTVVSFTPLHNTIALLECKADRRLQELMDRSNDGLLNEGEREEFEALVELSEELSLVRAGALQILGRRPG